MYNITEKYFVYKESAEKTSFLYSFFSYFDII